MRFNKKQNHSISYKLCLSEVSDENPNMWGYSTLCMKISPEMEFDQLSFIILPKVSEKISNVKDLLNRKLNGFGKKLQKIVDEKVCVGKKLLISKIDFQGYAHPDKGNINIKIVGKIDSKIFIVDAEEETFDGYPGTESINITEN